MIYLSKMATIALFVYNRPNHTKLTLDALRLNQYAEKSNLVIFSDGPKSLADSKEVDSVREIIHSTSGFQSVEIVLRKKNCGLANSIISGVNEILADSESVIVLEDDIITSPSFLSFMNQGLLFFADKKKVFHINGFSHNIPQNALQDIYMNRVMDCWGWATWRDRWSNYERSPIALFEQMDSLQRFKFDLDGTGEFWPQVEKNLIGEINTWAVFWYASIFLKGGLCVSPTQSYTQNIGFDGSGTHCLDEGEHQNISKRLNVSTDINFNEPLEENKLAISRIRAMYSMRKNIYIRLFAKVQNLLRK